MCVFKFHGQTPLLLLPSFLLQVYLPLLVLLDLESPDVLHLLYVRLCIEGSIWDLREHVLFFDHGTVLEALFILSVSIV